MAQSTPTGTKRAYSTFVPPLFELSIRAGVNVLILFVGHSIGLGLRELPLHDLDALKQQEIVGGSLILLAALSASR